VLAFLIVGVLQSTLGVVQAAYFLLAEVAAEFPLWPRRLCGWKQRQWQNFRFGSGAFVDDNTVTMAARGSIICIDHH